MSLCYRCMEERGVEQICPKCGFDSATPPDAAGPQLPPGTPFAEGKYLIGRVLGIGGFGITYIGYDTRLKIKLAIKEYFPRHLANRALPDKQVRPHDEKAEQDFRDGLRYFLREAQTAAKFDSHPHVVAVKDYFEEHGTAYIVMSYIEGRSFGDFLEKQSFGRTTYRKTIDVMLPILDALGKIHAANLLHRDISPENIYLTKDGTPKLLDFGAARYTFTSQTQSMSLTLKEGYAPIEQYSKNGEQGPWTDIYAVAATMYRALTGAVPPAALERLHEDTLKPPSKLGAIIPASAEKALLKALSLRIRDRYQDVASFRLDLVTTMPKPGLSSLFADWRVGAAVAAAAVVVVLGVKLFLDSNPDEKIPEEALRFIGKDANGDPLQPEQTVAADGKKRSVAPRFVKKQHPAPPKQATQKKESPRAEPSPAPKAEPEPAPQPQPIVEKQESSGDPSMRSIRKVQNKDEVSFIKASAPKGNPADLFKQGLALDRAGNVRKALEYYDAACEQNYSVACYQGAKVSGDKRLYAQSRALFEKECAAGKGFACTNYGTMLAGGEGGKKDIMKAREIFERSCKLDQAVACLSLAGMWEKGVGSVDDPYLAAKLYKRACELNAKEGCLKYADILASGASGEKEGEKAAKYYYLRACQLGSPAACRKSK